MTGRPRLLVSGSRFLTAERHADAVRQGLEWCGTLLGRAAVMVNGASPAAVREGPTGRMRYEGLDFLAAQRWERWRLKVELHQADWGEHGTAAGHMRNTAMVRACGTVGPALCMIWPYPDPAERSAGTWDLCRSALAADITVLSGWDLQPILTAPAAHELPPARTLHTGPLPHSTANGGA